MEVSITKGIVLTRFIIIRQWHVKNALIFERCSGVFIHEDTCKHIHIGKTPSYDMLTLEFHQIIWILYEYLTKFQPIK